MNPEQHPQSDLPRLPIDPCLLQSPFSGQPVLFVGVHEDDRAVLDSEEGEWLRALLRLDWRAYREVGGQYYQALWEFNVEAARSRGSRPEAEPTVPETRNQATIRLLFSRVTGGNVEAPILRPQPEPPLVMPKICPEHLEPGVVPFRLAGKSPKCFFALLKAFLGLHLMGKSATAEEVDHHLRISPTFARACGFTLPRGDGSYRQSDIPSLRKLQQFEQIMSARGLWSLLKIRTIRDNLRAKIVQLPRQSLAHDTTHYIAYSALSVVEVPEPKASGSEKSSVGEAVMEPEPSSQNCWPTHAEARGMRRAAQAERKRQRHQSHRQRRQKETAKLAAQVAALPGKASKPVVRKSQSKTIKTCRCSEKSGCRHPWVLSDPGAGTIVKGPRAGKKKLYWAQKAAVLSTAPEGIPLDATAMTDAASSDGTALVPHLRAFFATYPELRGQFREVDADSGYEGQDSPAIQEEFGLKVRVGFNRHRRLSLTEALGAGMKKLSPNGTLTCQAGLTMTYQGVRWKTEQFVYGPPKSSLGSSEAACGMCPLRTACCQENNKNGRTITIPFTWLGHIDPKDPPMARRFKVAMLRRCCVERAIKRIKLDFGDDHLGRRGNDAFQGHLDRSLIAFHLLLRQTG